MSRRVIVVKGPAKWVFAVIRAMAAKEGLR